jgi:hypothetical protein
VVGFQQFVREVLRSGSGSAISVCCQEGVHEAGFVERRIVMLFNVLSFFLIGTQESFIIVIGVQIVIIERLAGHLLIQYQ